MTTRPLLLGLAFCAVGCTDLPTGPDPTNPYDPAYSGSRQVSSPLDVALAASTSGSLTLTWTDASSFEAGYRIERAHIPVPTFSPAYRTVAVVGENVTTYTDDAPLNTDGYLYRVVGLAGPSDRESAPSEPLHVRIPSTTFSVSFTPYVGRPRFSPDGSLLYAPVQNGPTVPGKLVATETRTGRTAWSVEGVPVVVQTLSGGRVVAVDQSEAPSRLAVVGPGGEILRDVDLEMEGRCHVAGVDEALTRAVGWCSLFSYELRVWDLRDGRQVPSLTAQGVESVLAVSQEGALAVVRRIEDDSVRAYLIDQKRDLWSETACPSSPAAFTADGAYVYLTGCGGVGRLLHTQSGRPETTVDVFDIPRLDDSGRYLYHETSPYDDPDGRWYLRVFDVVGGALVRSVGAPRGYTHVETLSVLPDGGLIVLWDSYQPTVTRLELGRQWEVVEE